MSSWTLGRLTWLPLGLVIMDKDATSIDIGVIVLAHTLWKLNKYPEVSLLDHVERGCLTL
jgi:hypothetical protein